jgi:DNA-binding transcriptional regulator YhcF (GntR family)
MPGAEDVLEQLRSRILAQLHLGTLAPGDRLDSTRELAERTGAAPRTVMAAYRRLESEGIVEIRPRSGIFVAAGKSVSRAMLPQLASWVVDVLVQGVARGVPPAEFPERVRRCLETVRVRAACVECNRDQMESICTELTNEYGVTSVPVDLDALDAGDRDALDSLHNADVIVTTSFHAVQLRARAGDLGRPLIVISLRSDVVAQMLELLAGGTVYFIATDERFRAALDEAVGPSGHAGNARVLLVDRDDLESIPPDAPTYVTAAARSLVEVRDIGGRVIPVPRVFSLDSARALLSFIVGVNIAALQAMSS